MPFWRPQLLLLAAFLVACPDDTTEAPPDTSSDVLIAEVEEETSSPQDVPEVDTEPGLADNFGVEETKGEEDCEGLDDGHCIYPFPSNRFRKDGQLAFGAESLPMDWEGRRLKAESFASHDGFSTATPILFHMPGGTVDGAASPVTIARSLEADSPTVLLDAESGERIPHWLELDHFSVKADDPVFVMRPAVRLGFDRRYIVAIHGLVDEAGKLLEPEVGFVPLRDQTQSVTKGVHARRSYFEASVFDPLTAAGVGRESLQLAWDFTTASQENTTLEMRTIRDRMLEAVGPDGPAYDIDEVVEQPDAEIRVLVRGTAHVPDFMLPATEKNSPQVFRRDDAGLPISEGTHPIAFELQIPNKAFDDAPVAVLQYGHGLFGAKEEARNDWLRKMAQRKGFAILAVDMEGFSEEDIGIWGVVLTADVSAFPTVAQRPLQGVATHLAIQRMVSRLAKDTDPRITRAGGESALDASRLRYYGNSQGGTIGNILMAMSADVERGVLGVPGAAYALLLNRSVLFKDFAGIISIPFPDARDFVAMFGLLQTGFNGLEPLNFVQYIEAEPLPGSPAHRVLLQVAKEDAAVENSVSFLLARSIGVPMMKPAVRPIFGLEEQAFPYEGSAVVEYDFGHPDNPFPRRPPPAKNDTHEDLRKLDVAQDQLWHFLETGEVIEVCDGPCDPR